MQENYTSFCYECLDKIRIKATVKKTGLEVVFFLFF